MNTRLRHALFTKLNQRILLTSGLVLLILYVGGDVFKLKWIKPNIWYATSVPAIALGVNVYARLREEDESGVLSYTQNDEEFIHQQSVLNGASDNPFNDVIKEIEEASEELIPQSSLALPLVPSDPRTDPRMLFLQQAALMEPDQMVRFVEAAARLIPDTLVSPPSLSPQLLSSNTTKSNETSSRPKRTGSQKPQSIQSSPTQSSSAQSNQTQQANQGNSTKPSSSSGNGPGRVVELFPSEFSSDDSDPWGESSPKSSPGSTSSASVNEFFPDPIEAEPSTPNKRSGSSGTHSSYGSNSYSNGTAWLG